jgi:hypothetical protein
VDGDRAERAASAIIVLANSASGKIYPFGDRLIHIVLGDRKPQAPEAAGPE